MSTKSNAKTKNEVLNYDIIFNIINENIANKNLITMKLNQSGIIANMRTRNTSDFETQKPLDNYYQLVGDSRILVNAKKTKFQLWLTDDDAQLMIDNEIVTKNDLNNVHDQSRHFRTDMCFNFDCETFNKIMKVFHSKHAVFMSDIKTENA